MPRTCAASASASASFARQGSDAPPGPVGVLDGLSFLPLTRRIRVDGATPMRRTLPIVEVDIARSRSPRRHRNMIAGGASGRAWSRRTSARRSSAAGSRSASSCPAGDPLVTFVVQKRVARSIVRVPLRSIGSGPSSTELHAGSTATGPFLNRRRIGTNGQQWASPFVIVRQPVITIRARSRQTAA